MRTDRLRAGDLRAGCRRRAGLGHAHAAERQGTERAESARDEAGASQEFAAIEAAAGFADLPRDACSSTCLACLPFDQHRLPLAQAVDLVEVSSPSQVHTLR